jgi:NAD(P)-dependent dehydrogenase (short-subunit alcohol dehydrogenase family)
MPTDVTDANQCIHLIETTVRECGSLDILINNAGISAHALLEDVPADKLGWYEQLMRVNLWGSVYCTHAALPYLKASHGRIVAVSSLAGLVGVPGRTAYCASKFAMTGFFEALRSELKDSGVSVTVAYPGVVSTDIRTHGWNEHGEIAGVSGFRVAPDVSVAGRRDAQLDLMADLLADNLDLDAVLALLDGPPPVAPVIRSTLGGLP